MRELILVANLFDNLKGILILNIIKDTSTTYFTKFKAITQNSGTYLKYKIHGMV